MTSTIPANVFAGYGRQIQTDDDIAFGSPAQDLYNYVTEGELSGDPVDWTNAYRTSDGVKEALVLKWTNLRYVRMRHFFDVDETTRIYSAWSNVIGDTLPDPVVFSSAAADKQADITLSNGGLTLQTAGFNGSAQQVRTNVAKGEKRWSALNVDVGGNEVVFGIEDGALASGVPPSNPGNSANGVQVTNGTWGWEIRYNGSVLFHDYAGANRGVLAGDKFYQEFVADNADGVDDNDGQLQIWRIRTGGGGTILMTDGATFSGTGTAVTGLPWATAKVIAGCGGNGITATGQFKGTPPQTPSSGVVAFDS